MMKKCILERALFLTFIGLHCIAFGQVTDGTMGFFSPNVSEIDVLYIYKNPEALKNRNLSIPIDSITFKNLGYNRVVDRYPKNYKPAIDKLDYGVLYFAIKKIGLDYVEVFVDNACEKTAFMMRSIGTVVGWGDFLLRMHSIEFNDSFRDPDNYRVGYCYS